MVYRQYNSEPCIYAQRRQPETGAALPGMDADSRVPYRTPVEVVDIDLLLNGQAWIENKEKWLQGRIERVIWLWTVPYWTVVGTKACDSACAGYRGLHILCTRAATPTTHL